MIRRTPLLLTFGSPLDKTAFLFHVDSGGGDAREALASSVQPLIIDLRYRPKSWINVWSPFDIISGALNFYGPVDNQKDDRATTPIAAHVQYWDNDLIYRHILNAL